MPVTSQQGAQTTTIKSVCAYEAGSPGGSYAAKLYDFSLITELRRIAATGLGMAVPGSWCYGIGLLPVVELARLMSSTKAAHESGEKRRCGPMIALLSRTPT